MIRASFVPIFRLWPRLLQSSWIPQDFLGDGDILVLMKRLDRAGHQKGQAMIRGLEFSALTPASSTGGRWAGNGVDDLLCLSVKASTKIPRVQSLERFQVGEHVGVWGEWLVGSTEALCPFPHNLPSASRPSGLPSPDFITSFCNKLVKTRSEQFSRARWDALAN